MISLETLRRLIIGRRCVWTARMLLVDEHVVCRSAFPCLYGGGGEIGESSRLLEIFTHIPALLTEDDEVRDEIKGFMEIVLRNGSMHSEEFLHRYLFEFWDNIERPRTGLEMKERYFKCQGGSEHSIFLKEVVRKINENGKNIPDIIGCTTSNSVLIAEIKNEELDDRALGQILRYYYLVRTMCDRYFVNRDSSRVVPLLIAPSCPLVFWDSVPFHFREVLEIFYWRITSNGRIHLVDGKQSLRDSARTRLFRSH